MLIEELEHIRHAAPDDPAVVQSGQRLVLDLEVQDLELIGKVLRPGNQPVVIASSKLPRLYLLLLELVGRRGQQSPVSRTCLGDIH